MARREPIELTVEMDGQEQVAGTAWIHERAETMTFRYSDSYLASPVAYDLDPTLPASAGVFQSPPGKSIFNAFGDSAPDRWGQNLMRREERERAAVSGETPRTLRGADFLLGVRDDVRQGAIRLRRPGTGDYYSTNRNAVPRLMALGRLLHAVDRVGDDAADRDLKDLIDAGSSLGGARPKAAVIDRSGQLAIAKFPRSGSDEWDVAGWEEVELRLARRSGLRVTESLLSTVAGRNVLIVRRFDRSAGRRVGFASALTMLEATDLDQRSYLEIAEVIERKSPTSTSDLRELFCRIVFSILTGNTDDHLRNHAFLRQGRGWALSPAYDLNPNPNRPDRLSTAIDLDDATADIQTALSVSSYFRLSQAEARSLVASVRDATSGWRDVAAELRLPNREVDLMAVAFENDQRRAAQAV